MNFDVNSLFLRLDAQAIGYVLHYFGEIQSDALHRDERNLPSREVEEIVNQLPHPRGLFENRVQNVALLGRQRVLVAVQKFRQQRQRRKRRAQFVRQRRDQVGARAILITQVSHVLQDKERTERAALLSQRHR